MQPDALALYSATTADVDFTTLDTWGKTTLGIVTGDNAYFALTPERVAELGLEPGDLLPLSPPGSSHLRGLELSAGKLASLGDTGKQSWLFRPAGEPSEAARAYIAEGENAGMATNSYKCRTRKTWWRVPLLAAPHLYLTCMNADTARITTNEANAHHLNSVHGIYLRDEFRELGRELLPLASLPFQAAGRLLPPTIRALRAWSGAGRVGAPPGFAELGVVVIHFEGDAPCGPEVGGDLGGAVVRDINSRCIEFGDEDAVAISDVWEEAEAIDARDPAAQVAATAAFEKAYEALLAGDRFALTPTRCERPVAFAAWCFRVVAR